MTTKHPAARPLRPGFNHPFRRLQCTRLSVRLLPALVCFFACAAIWAQQAIKTGPDVGSTVPAFEAPDQNGQLQNLRSILGPKGALLVFFRSADW